jgi:hypothetical protein
MPLQIYKPGLLELVDDADDTENEGDDKFFELHKVFLRLLHNNKNLRQYNNDLLGLFESGDFQFVTNDMWIHIFSLLDNKEKKQLFEVLPKEKKSELADIMKVNGGGKKQRKSRRLRKSKRKSKRKSN